MRAAQLIELARSMVACLLAAQVNQVASGAMLEQWQSFSSSLALTKQLQDFFGLEIHEAEEPTAPGSPATHGHVRDETSVQQATGKDKPGATSTLREDGDSKVSTEDLGHTGAFSSLLSEDATLAAPEKRVVELSGLATESAHRDTDTRHSARPMYMPDMRMDAEDEEDQHLSAPLPADVADEPVESDALPEWQVSPAEDEPPNWLQLSSEGLISQWAPFSSYTGTDTQLRVRAYRPPQDEPLHALPPIVAPEGFQVLSVRHQESVSDPNAVSVGKYFYFDASAFPSFEFSTHPCLVEQWRGALLVWSGAVTLSLGALGAADLLQTALPATGRKEPRQSSQPGDFEVADVVSVVGFHRNLAVSVGKHMDFPANLFGYQSRCLGKRASSRQDQKYVDELSDLGKHMRISIEIDEKELIAIRGTTESRATMGTMLEPSAHVDNTGSVAELARENSLMLAGVDVAEEGKIPHNIRSSVSSEAWNARRQAVLSARPRHVPDREATL